MRLFCLRVFFINSSGEYRIHSSVSETVEFSGSVPHSITEDIPPFRFGDRIFVTASDSLTVLSLGTDGEMKDVIFSDSKITSFPVNGLIPTQNGLYEPNEEMDGFSFVEGIVSANDLKVLRDSEKNLLFVAGRNSSGDIFSIDFGNGSPSLNTLTVSPDSLYVFYILKKDGGDPSLMIRAFSDNDTEVILGLADIDGNGDADLIVSEGGLLTAKYTDGIIKNGFPVNTSLNGISRIYIYETVEKKKIVAFDRSSSYSEISAYGDYDRRRSGTMNSDGSFSNIFESDGYVYLYSHSESGILSYHRIGEGSVLYQRELDNGVVRIKTTDMSDTGGLYSGSVYNWPNPARGKETRFRFFLNSPCRVTVKIYDINGNRMNTLTGEFSEGGRHHEIVWDVSQVPSGVFNAVLEFDSGSRKDKTLVRTAVIK